MYIVTTNNMIGISREMSRAPVITSHPQDVEIQTGYRVQLEITATGTMPLCYQWYYENDIMPGMLHHIMYMLITINLSIGENKPYCCIFPVTILNAGCYYCQVKNQYDVVNSKVATVTVITMSPIMKQFPSKDWKFTYLPVIAEISNTQNTISPAGLES